MDKDNKQERFAVVPYWVFDTPELSSTDKLVFTALCFFRDKHGICYPSIAGISRLVSSCTRTVERSLNRLEEAGAITRRNRYNGGGKTSNEYFIPRHKVGNLAVSNRHKVGNPADTKSHEQEHITLPINRRGKKSFYDIETSNTGTPLAAFEEIIKKMMEDEK